MKKALICTTAGLLAWSFQLMASPSRLEKRDEQVLTFPSGKKIVLTNLNPFINKWFILEAAGEKLHLENTDAKNRLTLQAGEGLVLKRTGGETYTCKLWDGSGALVRDRVHEAKTRLPFVPICEGRMFIRLPHKESSTPVSLTEWGTEILRKTSFGEGVIDFFKPFLVEMKAEKADLAVGSHSDAAIASDPAFPPAIISRNHSGDEPLAKHSRLGMTVANAEPFMRIGRWYRATMHPGVFVSLFSNSQVTNETLGSFPERVSPLAMDELNSLSYEVAYDLDMYTLNYALGSVQPEVKTENPGWSVEKGLDNRALVPVGSIPPYMLGDAIAVFAGGFKNKHGFVAEGPHAGKKFGYIENGVELERMAPGLATFLVDTTGLVNIVAWPEDAPAQELLRERTVAARQNGLFLMKNGEPGEFVFDQKRGGWAGTAHGDFKSLRSGVCISENSSGRRFLNFFVFTRATPSALARSMQAYQCKVGMQLDMNFHIYMYHALYQINENKKVTIQHLHNDMNYDARTGLLRFVVDNNKRDFFYVYKKTNKLFQP